MRREPLVLVIGASLSLGCTVTGIGTTDLRAQVRIATFVPAPQGGVFAIPGRIVGTDEVVVAFLPPRSAEARSTLVRLDLAGGELMTISVPPEPDCVRTEFVAPQPLADGRVAYISNCVGRTPRVPARANRFMAYDPRTGQASELLPYPVHANVLQYSFAPDLSRGVLNDGNGLYGKLRWLLPDRTEPLDLALDRAGPPSWSPDGRSIAVPGVPQGTGGQGLGRVGIPQTLFVFAPDERTLRPLAAGLDPVTSFEWSPDSRWLIGTFARPDKSEALYLVEVATGRPFLLLEGKETGTAAFLDARTVAVTVGVDSRQPIELPGQVPAEQVGLLILELPDLERLAAR